MSTFSYTITFSDSQIIMLKSALELMIEHCQQNIDNGSGAPFWAHQESALNVLGRLNDDAKWVSGNNEA